MLAPALLDLADVPPAFAVEPFGIEQAFRPVAQRSLDPVADGDAKAGLGPLEQPARRLAIEHPPEDLLTRPAADLHVERNARGELRNAMVEKRAMDFEADRHRGTVDLAQNIVGQIADGVEIHHSQ